MSKDKYPSIFSPQMEAIVFIILQIFFAKHTKLKISDIWSCDTLRPIVHKLKYLMDYNFCYWSSELTLSMHGVVLSEILKQYISRLLVCYKLSKIKLSSSFKSSLTSAL